MNKKPTRFSETEQPLNWTRALLCGAGGAALMMAFVDTFYLMGLTSFSFETYVGSVLTSSVNGSHTWTLGLIMNWVVGAVFGIFYAYFFESVFHRSTTSLGALLGLGHAFVAAIALLPFFSIVHENLQTGFPALGFLGSRLGGITPVLFILGHVIFGAFMGTLYGPVHFARVHSREFEPGSTGMPGERGVITSEDDPEDRVAV